MHAADRAADEWARFELARSASSFSRRTQKVVDHTVSLSATLMRAGEVEEANRLLAEAEREVRTEEAALIETVNEVKAAGEIRKRRMSRLRLAKAFATATLSASMFVTSAFGVVLARSVIEDEPTVTDANDQTLRVAKPVERVSGLRNVELLPGVKVKMTKAELKVFERLAGGGDKDALRDFLEGKIPMGLIAQVEAALLSIGDVVAQRTEEVAKAVPKIIEEPKEPSQPAKAEEPKEEPDPAPSETPSEQEEEPEPTPEPQPSPSPTEEKEKQQESNSPLGDDWPL